MKLNKEQLEKDILTIVEMTEKYHDIVWEGQEMQENHFDNIPKAERVAIIGILNSVVQLKEMLQLYESWFEE